MARRRKGGPSSFCRQRRSVRKQTGRAPLLVCHGFSNISRRDQGPVQRFHFHCKQAANCRVILVAALQRLSTFGCQRAHDIRRIRRSSEEPCRVGTYPAGQPGDHHHNPKTAGTLCTVA